MMTRRVAAIAAASVLLAGCAAPTPQPGAGDDLGGSVTVFAAASLSEAFEEIADAFTAEHPGVTVTLSFGGSSGLATQLVQGAPADVFAAANPPDGRLCRGGAMCPRCRKMILPAAARVIRFEKTRRARHFHFMLETRRPKRPAA